MVIKYIVSPFIILLACITFYNALPWKSLYDTICFIIEYFPKSFLFLDILLPLPLLLALSPNISVAIVTGYKEESDENFKGKIETLNACVNKNVELSANEGCKGKRKSRKIHHLYIDTTENVCN